MIENTNPNLIPVYAEIFMLVAASAILLIDMFLSEKRRSLTYTMSLLDRKSTRLNSSHAIPSRMPASA